MLLFLVIVILFPVEAVQAAAGQPGTFQFGYGAHLSLQDPALNTVLQVIEKTGFDWIAVDYDWASHWPQRELTPQWEQLDALMLFAQEHGIAVMLSVTNPPSWALKESGPAPRKTANLVVNLLKRYPYSLGAVELFPGPNTVQGWGANPNPADYVQILRYTREALQANALSVEIVVGGLVPLPEGEAAPGDMPDLDFLRGLYQAQALEYTPVIGVRLPTLAGQPSQSPSTSSGNVVLRHYEQVRQVMLDNGHKNGLIWITGFSWPSELSNAQEQQTQWLQDAYLWISSQLYVGTAFFTLTQPNNVVSSDFVHPALQSLQQRINSEVGQNLPLPSTYREKSAPKSFSKITPP